MSQDIITGVAVLDASNAHLLVACHRPGKALRFASIPVYEPGGTRPQNFQGWKMRRDMRNDQAIAHMSPSLSLKNGDAEVFHNNAEWSIPFVEVEGSNSDNQRAYLMFRQVNPDWQPDAETE